jgi:4-cresol dehydrogenase (hydroxylating)
MGYHHTSEIAAQLENASLEIALAEWRTVLNPANVITDPSLLHSRASATFSTGQSIPAILKPRSVAEVQQCLEIATRLKIAVYPVSTGKNWGYGSGVPVSDHCVLMDLGQMQQIVDFNEKLGYVTVEPGVTQAQLHAYLTERKSKLWMDATGSSKHCSIIGNTLERGFGHTPYGDHFGQVCSFEVVLPNGELLETGFSRSAGVAGAPVYRWGVGPSLDGLFAQSNLGVVTKMTLWLMPAPEYFEAFFFSCDDESALGSIVEALQPLRMNGTLRSAVHIANDYKVLQGIQQYPWQEAGNSVPLQPDLMRTLRLRLRFGAWNGSGGLYGTRAQVAEARRLVRKALKGRVHKLHFLNEKLLGLAERYSKFFRFVKKIDFRRTISLVRPVFGLLRGVPTERSLASAYWRKRTPPPSSMNPDADRCGLLWQAPLAPAEGDHAERIASLARSILLEHGFEPALSFTLLTERALICVIALTYDRDTPGEDQRASSCFKQLTKALTDSGYMPYRLGIQSMDLAGRDASSAGLVRAIKAHTDPANILAPGRYQRVK